MGAILLGISHTREARPADIGAMRKQVNEIFWLGQLAQKRWPPDTASQQRRGSHDDDTEEEEMKGTGQEKKKSGERRINNSS